MGIVSPLIFWDLTPREIGDIADHETQKLKTELFLNDDLAHQISFGVARVLGATKDEPMSVQERYPELFSEFEEQRAIDAQLELNKQNFIAYAEMHNANRIREASHGT